MRTFRLGRPSPALVVSIIALIVALGGTSYAAFSVPRDSVGSRQLRKNAVTTKKIANGAVTGAKIAKGTITAQRRYNINRKLGTVPSATNASHATDADELGSKPPVRVSGEDPVGSGRLSTGR